MVRASSDPRKSRLSPRSPLPTATIRASCLQLLQLLQLLLQAAFGYGSGVFEQPGLYSRATGGKPMLDLIIAVESPLEWREQVVA